MKAILAYKIRERIVEDIKGSITYKDKTATFKTVLGGPDYVLKDATLTQLGGWPPNHNIMHFTGLMNGWETRWIIQAKEG